MARIMGIDYGLKRIGIAVTDPEQIIASPLCTVAANTIFSFIEDYITQNRVECIVVGYPLNLDGTPTHITAAVEKFIKDLAKKFNGISIVSEDERNTSQMAMRAMIDGGVKKMKRRDKSMIDKISAVFILRSYLERKSYDQKNSYLR
jgi:putative holliday junction resolvase